MLVRNDTLRLWCLLIGVVLATGCDSGGTAPPVDSGATPDLGQQADGPAPRPDGPVVFTNDFAVDSVTDGVVADQSQGDATAGDAAPDQFTVGLPPKVWGYVSRGTEPGFDAKGDLYVLANILLIPPPGFAQTFTKIRADLSASGDKVKYELSNLNANGKYFLWAFLDDNVDANGLFLGPGNGDLTTVLGTPLEITIPSSGALQQDLVLSEVVGAAGTTLRGTIKASVAPAGDGRGPLYAVLRNDVPPKGVVIASMFSGEAGLSSPFATEHFFISSVAPGKYFLQVFLDDNANASLATLSPDSGDMIHAQPIPVRIETGSNVQHVVIDATQ